MVKVYSEKPKRKEIWGNKIRVKLCDMLSFLQFSPPKNLPDQLTCFLRKCNLSAWVGLVKAAGMVVEAKFHYSIVDRRTETQHQVTSEGSSFVNKSTCNK